MKLATSPTLSGIENLINQYFFSTSIKVNPETLEITNSKGQLNNFTIEKKKGKFVFSNNITKS